MRPKISCRCSSAPPASGFSRSCQLTTSRRTNARLAGQPLELPHAPRERVDDAVDEPRALDGSVALGETDSFLDDDLRRRLPGRELGRGETQHRAVDRAESLEAPVRGDRLELAVDLRAVGDHDADDPSGDRAL